MKSLLLLIALAIVLLPIPLLAQTTCPVARGNGDGSAITWTCPRRYSVAQNYYTAQHQTIAILNDHAGGPIRVTRWEQDPNTGVARLDDYPLSPLEVGHYNFFPANGVGDEVSIFIWCPAPQQGRPVGVIGTVAFDTVCE